MISLNKKIISGLILLYTDLNLGNDNNFGNLPNWHGTNILGGNSTSFTKYHWIKSKNECYWTNTEPGFNYHLDSLHS